MISRLGTALILVGIIALVVFLLTYQVQEADLNVLLFGVGASLFGLLFRRRGARQSTRQSTRFQMLRRFKDGGEDLDE
ncbi:MAG: hypothetical protein ACERKX_12020 [Anaerolineales bacterium]